MIEELSLENFKGFSSKQIAPLSYINLVYGPNTAGKSSIIQSLLILQQSLLEGARYDAGFMTSGESTIAGNYRSLLAKHQKSDAITIGLKLHSNPEYDLVSGFSITASPSDKRYLYGKIDKYKFSTNHGNITLKRARNAREAEGYEVYQLSDPLYELSDKTSAKVLSKLFENSSFADNSHFVMLIHKEGERIKTPIHQSNLITLLETALFGMKKTLPVSINILLDPDSPYAEYSSLGDMLVRDDNFIPKAGFFDRSNDDYPLAVFDTRVHSDLNQLTYIGPLRSPPQRIYEVKKSTHKTVGQQGQNLASMLYANQLLTIEDGSDNPWGEERMSLVEKVNYWLDELNIPYSISIKEFEDEGIGQTISLRFLDKRYGISLSLADVGFGVSQILPILAEGLMYTGSNFPRRQLICIEQPELHLHPRLQASLMDFFIQTGIDGKDNDYVPQSKKQWIIETHSEALALRLQRRIRQGVISPEDVSILYVHPTEKGSVILRLRLDEKGVFIDNWPGGFFVDSFEDIFGDL